MENLRRKTIERPTSQSWYSCFNLSNGKSTSSNIQEKCTKNNIDTQISSNITETEVFWKNHRNDFHGSWCSWFGTRKTRWKIENLCEKHWKTIEFTKWWLQLKKNIGKTGCYHFVIRYFHTKISGLLFALQQIFCNPELSTKLPQWWCAKSAKSAGSFLTQKTSCNSSPKSQVLVFAHQTCEFPW